MKKKNPYILKKPLVKCTLIQLLVGFYLCRCKDIILP